ncbi:MAG: rRNA maturation RNase YbeY [Acidobacteria bacterium]|nr:rRNA maturation RNase YbeY [Acidobacteriota bacterium]
MELIVLRRRRHPVVDARACRRLVRHLAERMERGPAACAILLCDDREIETLNRRFLHRPQPTDVLAFPAGEPAGGHLGDIAISLETAARQATRHGRTLQGEVHALIVHGFLHLLGYDHETDGGEMRRTERALLREWAARRRPRGRR